MQRRELYRVVLWGPGYTGQQALRELLARPEIDVVGCLAYSPEKVGRDIGDLIGQQPVGVTVTGDPAAICALDADIVVYAGRSMPDETQRHGEVASLLASGKNVVTSTAYFFPWQRGSDYVEPLQAACAAGGSTLHGTGIHPGWFLERFAMTATSLFTRFDRMVLQEVADLRHHAGEAIAGIGFGAPQARLGSTRRKAILSRYYHEMIAFAAHTLGEQLDIITSEIAYVDAPRRIETATVTIEPGTVAAVDATWTGRRGGEPIITMRAFWYMDPGLVDFTEITSPDFYDLQIQGRPIDLHTRVDMTVTQESDVFGVDDAQSGANLTTAVQLVNMIPAVVAASPGIMLAPVAAHASRDLRRVGEAPLNFAPIPTDVSVDGTSR